MLGKGVGIVGMDEDAGGWSGRTSSLFGLWLWFAESNLQQAPWRAKDSRSISNCQRVIHLLSLSVLSAAASLYSVPSTAKAKDRTHWGQQGTGAHGKAQGLHDATWPAWGILRALMTMRTNELASCNAVTNCVDKGWRLKRHFISHLPQGQCGPWCKWMPSSTVLTL